MRCHRPISLSLIVLSLAACARPRAAANETPRALTNTRLILIAKEEQVQQEKILLELVRSRMPVVVQRGRFVTDDGVTNTCIYARRSSGRGELAKDSNGLPFCPLLGAYQDGVWIGDAGTHLANVRSADFESVELLSASDAMQRYGLSAAAGDVLVLWTRGRGPHAVRPGR
ncbi:MAG: hypothetical protein ACRENP_00560 [Longimicrobiales bacterium]